MTEPEDGDEEEGGDRIIRYPEAMKMFGAKSRSTIFKWMRQGRFPPCVQVGPMSVGWWESTLRQHKKSLPQGPRPRLEAGQ